MYVRTLNFWYYSPKPYVGAGSPEIWQPDDNLSKPALPALPPAGLAD
ncbi:MAG: hypothetical protein F6K14_07950 [Symploca sp. SIO2C1]|nr:hypothetical protein [Symploca sp. SIO2C1]